MLLWLLFFFFLSCPPVVGDACLAPSGPRSHRAGGKASSARLVAAAVRTTGHTRAAPPRMARAAMAKTCRNIATAVAKATTTAHRLPSRNDRGGAAGDGRTCPPSAPPDLWSAFQRPRSHPPCPPTHCSSPPSAPLALPSPLPQLPLLCHCRLSSVNNTPTGPSPQPAWPRRPPRCRPLPSTVRRPADSGSHSTATPRARPSRHDPPAARPSNAPVPRLQPTLSPPSAHGRGGQRGRPW